jgi:hypothetical protein
MGGLSVLDREQFNTNINHYIGGASGRPGALAHGEIAEQRTPLSFAVG